MVKRGQLLKANNKKIKRFICETIDIAFFCISIIFKNNLRCPYIRELIFNDDVLNMSIFFISNIYLALKKTKWFTDVHLTLALIYP